MSYDEFPPDAQPLPDEASAAADREETSAQDAPPAAPTRRRRARAAGTDAASETPTETSDTPARTRRRRTPVSAQDETTASTDADPTIIPPETENAPEARPARRRRAVKADLAAETPADMPEPEATAAPETEAAQPKTRRTRRSKADTAAPESDSPLAQPATESATEPVEPEAKPARRRRSVRKSGEEETTSTDLAGGIAPSTPESADETAPPVEAGETPTEPGADGGRNRRRQRGGRNRRGVRETPEAEAFGLPDSANNEPEALAANADIEAPVEGGTDAPEFLERRRRNRRGGRNRRGDRLPTGVGSLADTESDELDGLIAPVVEEIEAPVDLSVGAHLLVQQGIPRIQINDVAHPPLLFFGNMEGMKNSQRVLAEVRRAAQAGVHLHSTLVELPCPLSEASHALDEIDERLRALLDADPEGYVMPRIVFVPARGWKREYPTEISTYADGTAGDPSITSERFWQECERSLQSLIAHLQGQFWGGRVFGYHLERGEWFQPADTGYDRSTANRDAFRDWLRDKYEQNLVALRAAWYDGDVQFHTAEIPPAPGKPNPQRTFYEPRRERSVIDFNEFTSESTARRLVALAKVVKKAANRQALVSVCYGYTFEFGHGFSGHLALATLLASPHIDIISGPPSYRDRKPGGAASLPAPVASLALHGKLWLSEDDTKTFLAPVQQEPGDFNPRLGDRFATEQAQARALGRALAQRTGIGFMDLWGEGWLDDDALWERIAAFRQFYSHLIQNASLPESAGVRQTPEVIALIDEKSLLHIQKGEPFFRRMTNGLRDTLQRAGVSYATYLQSDLLHSQFPTDARLYIFLTPYRLTTDQRAAVQEKLQNGNKTLAWLYAPGACERRPKFAGGAEESTGSVLGLSLRPQEWNSEIGSRILEPNHPVTERIHGRDLGTKERLNPSFYVDDNEATRLAEYQSTGLPSLAARSFGSWKSVFVGDPFLPLELLRGLCRYADVHLWLPQGEDVVSAGHGWITIHGARDGQRTLRLPATTGLYDLTEQRLVADETREYRFFLKLGATRTFAYGPTERFLALGLPNVTPLSERERIVVQEERAEAKPEVKSETKSDPKWEPKPDPRRAVLPPPVPPRPDRAPRVPPERVEALQSDLETLEAVLSMDVSAYDALGLSTDLEDDVEEILPTLPGENLLPSPDGLTSDAARRRRRRGGRGRGRRRLGSITEARIEITGEITSVPPVEPAPADMETILPFPPFPTPFHEDRISGATDNEIHGGNVDEGNAR